jgi:small-conductance mechanosensitive channel
MNEVMEADLAMGLLQLVALSIPPIAVLIQMLRRSEDLEWRLRKLSFGLAISSVVAFIATGAVVVGYFLTAGPVSAWLVAGMILILVGLVPFALFTGILYIEHKRTFA